MKFKVYYRYDGLGESIVEANSMEEAETKWANSEVLSETETKEQLEIQETEKI